MRRQARRESASALRRKLYGEAEAEIGSRVFPLPAPASQPMPSVGARRSTRVFVAKPSSVAVAANACGDDSRILRSGKRLAVWKRRDEWLDVFSGDTADLQWWKREDGERRENRDSIVWNEPEARAAGIVRELPESYVPKDSLDCLQTKKFGMVYGRKRQRQLASDAGSPSSSVGDGDSEMEKRYGLVFMRRGRRKRLKVGPVPVAIERERVEISNERGVVKRQPRIAVSSVNGEKKICIKERSLCIAAGGPVELSLIVDSSCNMMLTNALPSCGLCKIYGSIQSVPIIWLDISALPSYFRSLHVSFLLGSLYLPRVLARTVIFSQVDPYVAVNCGENDSDAFVEADYLGTKRLRLHSMDVCKQNDLVDAYRSFTQNAIPSYGLRRSKHRRRRSSSSCKDESDVSSPLSSQGKQKKSAKKSPVEQNKELKSALAEVKQNIDSVHCKANVLVTDSDRCWREEGFEVMLDMLAPKDWCITVKSHGQVRYLHRPLDMRPCFVNRFTHAYMWAGEDRWKLEFLDRWDWLVFKELHAECRERNQQDASFRMIPVPIFEEVSSTEACSAATFVHPDEYIRMEDDEVQRALFCKIARYDMDSGDEQWLDEYNSSIRHMELGELTVITADNFEKLIYAMEKDAFSNVDDVFDKEKALDLYQNFGMREMLGAVYDYWIRKRNKRCAALVREFQVIAVKLSIIIVEPHEEALQRVQEAKNAAKKAVELAIHLRGRAQMLMSNAELLVYKSVMALRIAESMEACDTSDPAPMILD
ncbi:hypothetical protein B296_00008802 [Ensete ventricosum]|uniref:Enhancer of polycomb-like protein n=1 Tax=Ensete ventricosum TaxID=4639 RepID=A0A427AAM9_ENSVE|nr:hypothetical protein B296_00008802 [Ensete ventricosum]